MLTGDAKETAVAIAQQVGLYGPQGVPIRNSAISGEEIGKFFFYCLLF
jgi:magnesium-transporting ATPase (P-type)